MPESQAALVSPFNFAVDSKGNIYFADPFGEIGVRVFTSDGRYLRTVGKRGQGPGEFMSVGSLAIGYGDSLHVFHAGHSVFNPEGRHVRTQTVLNGALARRVRLMPDGGFVANALISTPAAYGYPLHLVDRQDETAKSFGLNAEGRSPSGLWAVLRSLSAPVRGTFWSGHTNAYVLEQYSVDGSLLRILRRDVDWFKPWDSWDSQPDAEPAPPRIMSIVQDPRSGFLWVLMLVADAHWRARNSGSGGERPLLGTRELTDLLDSVVEVIDPARAQLVASQRFPSFFVELVEPGTLIELMDLDGETVVGISDILLSRRVGR